MIAGSDSQSVLIACKIEGGSNCSTDQQSTRQIISDILSESGCSKESPKSWMALIRPWMARNTFRTVHLQKLRAIGYEVTKISPPILAKVMHGGDKHRVTNGHGPHTIFKWPLETTVRNKTAGQNIFSKAYLSPLKSIGTRLETAWKYYSDFQTKN